MSDPTHAAPARPLPNRICPVCGAPNQCAPAACGRFDVACWCSQVKIGARALSRVPAELQGQACLCPAYAALPDH